MISVCVATLNGEKYIKQQLSSIISQLGEGDEVILSDDGSTDGTLEEVKSLGSPLIRVVEGPRKGVIKNFENAIKQSQGDYIFLADQDDVWMENKVEVMLRELENATCVVSDCVVVDGELSVISDSFYKVNGTRFGRFYNTVCKNGYLGCCMAFRRELISKALPIPDEIATHDGWFGNVAAYFYTVKFIDDKLILFRRHPGNNSTTASASKNGLFKRLGFRWDIIKNIRKLKRSK